MSKFRTFDYLLNDNKQSKIFDPGLKANSLCCDAKIKIENIWFGARLGQKRLCSQCGKVTNIYRQVSETISSRVRAERIKVKSDQFVVVDEAYGKI